MALKITFKIVYFMIKERATSYFGFRINDVRATKLRLLHGETHQTMSTPGRFTL